jgi:hypothetical protein
MAFLSQNNNLQRPTIEESIFASDDETESDIYLQNNGNKRTAVYVTKKLLGIYSARLKGDFNVKA